MKYYAQLAVAALVLFSLSASLSVWLNQSRQTTEAKENTDKSAKKPSKEDAHPEKEKDEKSGGKSASHDAGSDPLAKKRLDDIEDRLDRRKKQQQLIEKDLDTTREAVDALLRQVTAETKEAAVRVENEQKSALPPPKTAPEQDPVAERKSIDQLAKVYDAMVPDNAASILKQMADGGKLDTVVRILAAMKERQAAQVLAALSDPTLAGQITDRLRTLKKIGVGTAPGVTPAGGASAAPLTITPLPPLRSP